MNVILQRKPSNLKPGKRVQSLNYDNEYGKTSCNGIGNKVPFMYLSVTLFCLLSEVLAALPTLLRALLLHREQGIKLMEFYCS